MSENQEKISWYTKFRNFLNDEENGLLLRTLMVIFGIAVGAAFIVWGGSSPNLVIQVNLIILGWLTILGFGISAIVWYYNESY